jgi:hypothetical protein
MRPKGPAALITSRPSLPTADHLLLRISACLAWCTFAAGLAGAQQFPARGGVLAPTCQFDTSAFRDTTDYSLFLTVPRSVPGAAKRHQSYAPYISAIASTFEQPPRLSLTYWPGTDASDIDEANEAVPVCSTDERWCNPGILDGEVQFRFENGRVGTLEWRLSPDSPEAGRALEQAIRRADSLNLFPGDPRIRGLPRGTVRLGFRLARELPLKGGLPLSRIRLPYIRATAPVAIIFQPEPQFPSAMAGANVTVSFTYIVAEDGRVIDETIRTLDEGHPAFVRAAKHAIRISHFRPAQAGSCPVKMLVQQRVVFRSR